MHEKPKPHKYSIIESNDSILPDVLSIAIAIKISQIFYYTDQRPFKC